MLNGKTVIFLSCTGRSADTLARPIRNALNAIGFHAVIVTDEPLLRGTFDPESKVSAYIDASDAFVALCTEDPRLPGSTAGNVIDEIARARAHPKLRDVVCVLKEPNITLPSNINPTWEVLSSNDPETALSVVKEQLNAWDVSPSVPHAIATSSATLPDGFLDDLLDGVELGDHDLAEQCLLNFLATLRREFHPQVIDALFDSFTAADEEGVQIHILSSFLEAASRIDPQSVSMERLAALSESTVFQHRSCVATILWDLADTSPGRVPLDILAALARPSHEDWYVYSPALAAVKQLALTRKSAWHIIEALARSDDADDRSYAASAAIDVAKQNPSLVPLAIATLLSSDDDDSVAEQGRRLRELIKGAKRSGAGCTGNSGCEFTILSATATPLVCGVAVHEALTTARTHSRFGPGGIS